MTRTFNGSDEGFVHGGSPDLWEWGTPGAEPGACFDGACWCTGLDSDYGTDSFDTLASRGFGLLSIHTQSFYAGGPLERAMPAFLASVAQERSRLWAASGEACRRLRRQHVGDPVTT